MRIAYCIHSLHLFGGVERVLALKADYLARVCGHEVHIITANLKGRKPRFVPDPSIRLTDLGVNENLFPRRYARRLDAELRRIRPDITVSVGGRGMEVLSRCTDGSRKVAEYHFSHEKFRMKYGGSAIGRLYASWRTRRVEKAAAGLDAFVVLTESDRGDWEKSVPGVVAISNPVTFTSAERSPLERKRAVAVGRLVSQKNFADAVSAWKAVAVSHPGWTLDIYGEGSLRKELGKKIQDSGLSGKVRLMGASENIHKELLDSSFLLMTSRYEGFPMVLLEAAECGLPMVSYDCPKGPAEIIRNGVNGFLVPAGDVRALSEAAARLADDPSLLRSMGEEARKTASAYGIETIMAKWNALFTGLLSSSRPA